jgi:hypothetical protein
VVLLQCWKTEDLARIGLLQGCVLEVGIFAKMGLQQYEDLDHCLAVAVDAAKKAGEVILDSFHKAKAVELKGMVSNFLFEYVQLFFQPRSSSLTKQVGSAA